MGNKDRRELDGYIKYIKEDKPFSYIRFGDGEIICLLGHQPHVSNYDDDYYGVILGKEILKIIQTPILKQNFFYGLAPHISRIGGNLLNECKRKPKKKGGVRKWNDNIKWVSATTFIDANKDGYMREFISALNHKTICLVANDNFKDIKILEGKIKYNINIPHTATWVQEGENVIHLIKKISSKSKKSIIFLIGAGMSSLPIIYNAYKEVGEKDILIDIGSALDPYIKQGRFRSWMVDMPNKSDIINEKVLEIINNS